MAQDPDLILLDTDVVSQWTKKRPHPDVIDWLHTCRIPLAIPFGAVYEIERGICRLEAIDQERAISLRNWLDDLLASELPFLGMDVTTARIYADITTHPALQDLWMPDTRSRKIKSKQDLAIAALAIARSAAIATMNVRDFLRIHTHYPLPGIYNPASAEWIIPYHKVRRRFRCLQATPASAAPLPHS